MRGGKNWRMLVMATSLLIVGGCASSEEWQTWRESKSHFASKEHFDFSMRNRGSSAATVTKNDVALAQQQSWFGRPVTVNQDQILER